MRIHNILWMRIFAFIHMWRFHRLHWPCRYASRSSKSSKKRWERGNEGAVPAEAKCTEKDGKTHRYAVSATEVLEKTELERLSATEHDLTIFTCTNGGYSRFVVRCDLLENKE